jgi:predicted DCC family thiol-disulfide oxidoreductase YuxK
MVALAPGASAVTSRPGVAIETPILFFDGTCGLCDRTVQFALARVRTGTLHVAPLDGDTARTVLAPFAEALAGVDSVVWYSNVPAPQVSVRSDAVVALLRALGGPWGTLATVLTVLPRGVRDAGYAFIARTRYRIFGRVTACGLWPAAWRAALLP